MSTCIKPERRIRRAPRSLRTGAAVVALAILAGSLWMSRSQEGERTLENPGSDLASTPTSREPVIRTDQSSGVVPTPSPAPALAEQASPAPAPALSHGTSVPGWIKNRFEDSALTELHTNRDLLQLMGTRLNPEHLDGLKAIIEANALSEASSPFDHDDGNGVFEPWELGFQLWRDGQLVALSFGPDPHSSYRYELVRLPQEVSQLDRLEYLDVQGNPLTKFPYAIGELSQLRELRANRISLQHLPESMDQLANLRVLMLAQNHLQTLPHVLTALKSLEILRLDENPLEQIPRSVGEMQALRYLGISRTFRDAPLLDDQLANGGITELPLELGDLPLLEAVYVTGNQLGCRGNGNLAWSFERTELRIFGLTAQHCARP
jgi:hypothetical protein